SPFDAARSKCCSFSDSSGLIELYVSSPAYGPVPKVTAGCSKHPFGLVAHIYSMDFLDRLATRSAKKYRNFRRHPNSRDKRTRIPAH
ncbi:MAG: hypothetical protein MUC83_15450, partial [Pirellula sp.]|nr:hypothetical protein [Pirellula sp.]